MEKFTQGPWKAKKNARTASVITDMADGSYGQAIAILQQVQKSFVMPNAFLMAAAPELYYALKTLLETHNCDDGSADYDGATTECAICKPAHVAIAKAVQS
jgi:hypothetical protein